MNDSNRGSISKMPAQLGRPPMWLTRIALITRLAVFLLVDHMMLLHE